MTLQRSGVALGPQGARPRWTLMEASGPTASVWAEERRHWWRTCQWPTQRHPVVNRELADVEPRAGISGWGPSQW